MNLNNLNNLIFPALIVLTILLLAFIVYQNTNKYFRLGYSRAKKVVKSFYPILQKKAESITGDQRIAYIKRETYNLLVKPTEIFNVSEKQRVLYEEIQNLKRQRDGLLAKFEVEKIAKIESLNFKLKDSLTAFEIKRDALGEKKEKFFDEVLALENEIKNKESALFDKA
ncbi:MAG: hypothetical protein NT091_02460, partial [Candidatus Falkowbacteria bacterium]|nr:hypothetical protein [Candidatus Falkowbacteria bacterium]